MLFAAKSLFLLALIVWLGETIFLSFVVAPTLFTALPQEAGAVMSALFPWYYRVGYACGALLLITSAILWRAANQGGMRWGMTTAVAALMMAAVLYAGVGVHPQARALRLQLQGENAPASAKHDFDRLHRRSVQLNSIVLLGGLGIAALTAMTLRVDN